eukprot:TRINITY_DN2288_c0_g1_i3.p1 TRINITY_DN2288_c0_g1~~TRINITY_DN2288_c0_g1_i3.p1  ORF type:complete len:402 (-),score=64.55 TRINITY_DN2288_c0_g1_i3:27-1232(-)
MRHAPLAGQIASCQEEESRWTVCVFVLRDFSCTGADHVLRQSDLLEECGRVYPFFNQNTVCWHIEGMTNPRTKLAPVLSSTQSECIIKGRVNMRNLTLRFKKMAIQYWPGITVFGGGAVITRCTFSSTTEAALLRGNGKARFESCNFMNSQTFGLVVDEPDIEAEIVNCTFSANLCAGLLVSMCKSAHVVGCTFERNNVGAVVTGFRSSVTVEDCRMEHNLTHALSLRILALSTEQRMTRKFTKRLVLRRNTIGHNGKKSVFLRMSGNACELLQHKIAEANSIDEADFRCQATGTTDDNGDDTGDDDVDVEVPSDEGPGIYSIEKAGTGPVALALANGTCTFVETGPTYFWQDEYTCNCCLGADKSLCVVCAQRCHTGPSHHVTRVGRAFMFCDCACNETQ